MAAEKNKGQVAEVLRELEKRRVAISGMLKRALRAKCKKGGLDAVDVMPQMAWGFVAANGDADFFLSVQGSAYHHSVPNRSLPYKEYEALEVEFRRASGEQHELIAAGDVLGSECGLVEELAKYEHGAGSYWEVPVELVERLYQECKARWGFEGV